MLDFFLISQRSTKRGVIEIYPKFIIKTSQDLMIRGGDFYAIWNEEEHLWSTDEEIALKLIDKELDLYSKSLIKDVDDRVKVLHMWDAETGMIDKWHKFVQKQMRDNYHPLDEKLVFSNTEISKTDYASKKLPYYLEPGNIDAYDELIGTLYSESERKKIEWAIGSIVANESKDLQKFLVMYGAAGTGKSTVLNIIQDLFSGYYSVFDAKALGSSNNAFALEAFKSNPLVAIQHDGDLSRIEDNTRLNSVVSHELMTVNEKFKSTYSNRFNCFLFMGTNKPVKITDAKSGILRRLIDVSPTGNKVSARKYKELTKQIKFELGPIAYHCMSVYLDDPSAYDDYVPMSMLDSTNDFYNFVLDSYDIFKAQDGTTLKAAWEMYKAYCEDARVLYPYGKRAFKNELLNYFEDFSERGTNFDGDERVRNVYSGFIFDSLGKKSQGEESDKPWLNFADISSAFDAACAELPAQYASKDETPKRKWSENKSILQNLNTHKLHYVKVPLNHIVIDFDIPDENGNKSYEKNFEAASQWPPTYAELSKSGSGIHLHYIYNGDPMELSRVYDDNIEIKVFSGKASLRRKLTKCNNLPISSISSGLPLKSKGDKMINYEVVKTEKGLRKSIEKALNKDVHSATKPNIDFIDHILNEMYESGKSYDVSDLKRDILKFAASSSHQAPYCIKKVNEMKFKSDDIMISDSIEEAKKYNKLVFFDIEVFPNLLLVNWKYQGKDVPMVRMINPSPEEIEDLLRYKLIGFNCRRYDNHILHYRLMGYNNEQLYKVSQRIISGDKTALSGSAYNYSYTDVYDFCVKKQSLKKWEIELGIHHKELGLAWDEPVPEERWEEVALYCDNDVIATEAVFDKCKGDFLAREILADVAGGTVNDTTNSLTTKIIFGNNRNPQDSFNYRDMGDVDLQNLNKYHTIGDGGLDESLDDPHFPWGVKLNEGDDNYIVFDSKNRPLFPGYIFDHGKSTYRDFEVGEGGFAWSKPGMYSNVVCFDVSGMHPASIIAEELFGPVYTQRFKDIVDARIAIKHKDFDSARKMLGGVLEKYLDDESQAKSLAQALKIAVNSVYGLTAARFDNPFRDKHNKDNIVAKRGALFMINLKYELERFGFEVIHIKTDSVKVVCNTKDEFEEAQYHINRLGRAYKYDFEIEHSFEKFCIVDKANYIAKTDDMDPEEPNTWIATGDKFSQPYIFKTLFSHEPIEFKDLCVTNSVTTAIYLDMNENLPDVTEQEKQLDKLEKKYREGELSDTTFEHESNELLQFISEGHNYKFVGRVGEFCPILDGKNGGILVREGTDRFGKVKYDAVNGSKGYRWLESETVKVLEKEDDINKEYFTRMVDDAVDDISEFGNIDWFLS